MVSTSCCCLKKTQELTESRYTIKMRAVGSLLVTFSFSFSSCCYFIKPQQLFHFNYSSSSLFPSHSSPIPIIKSLSLSSRFSSRRDHLSISTTAVMGANKVSPDHFTGAWFSVPGLRLRDHRFTVPLDYSLPDHSTISVFAREVVSGNSYSFFFG